MLNKGGTRLELKIRQLLLDYFPQRIQENLAVFSEEKLNSITEIRCRLAKPLQVIWSRNERKTFTEIILQQKEMDYLLLRLNQGSVYAWQEEYKRGYLTLPGGHRVGLVGKAVLEQGRVKTLYNISSLNFRIAHEVYGAADKLLPYLREEGAVVNTLLVAPPGCGKTTMLRDVIRQLSAEFTVGVVDERSEIAATVNGISQLDVGWSTDVLDSCPKSEGMKMLIRSMAPDILATDEIGTREDIIAVEEALQAGISVILTAHGKNIEDIYHHPYLSHLTQYTLLKRIVILAQQDQVGEIKEVYAAQDGEYFSLLR